MVQVRVEAAEGVELQATEDGKHTAILFNTASGVAGAVLANDQLAHLTALLIDSARQIPLKAGAKEKGADLSEPIEASGVRVTPGEGEGEARLAIQVNNLTLTFQVEASALREACAQLGPTV